MVAWNGCRRRFLPHADDARLGRLFFTSQGRTGVINADGTGLRYFDFEVPQPVTWQPGPFLSDGRRGIFLSMEERRDGPARPFDKFYHPTPTRLWIYDLDRDTLTEIGTKDRLAVFYTPALLVSDERILVQVVRGDLRQSTKARRRLEPPCVDAEWPGPLPATFSRRLRPVGVSGESAGYGSLQSRFQARGSARRRADLPAESEHSTDDAVDTGSPERVGLPRQRFGRWPGDRILPRGNWRSARNLGDGHRWTARTLAHARDRRPGGRPSCCWKVGILLTLAVWSLDSACGRSRRLSRSWPVGLVGGPHGSDAT